MRNTTFSQLSSTLRPLSGQALYDPGDEGYPVPSLWVQLAYPVTEQERKLSRRTHVRRSGFRRVGGPIPLVMN